MTSLGVRCSNRDFVYAVLNGTKDSPHLVALETLSYPKGYAKHQSLNWLLQEVDGLLGKHELDKLVLKRSEGKSRGTPFEVRVEHEAAVMIGDERKGLRAVFRKVKSTIAKDLGQKGRARYLGQLYTQWLPSYNDLN